MDHNNNQQENISTSPNHKKRTKLIIITFIIAVILGLSYFLYDKFILSNYEETDNAYIQGNMVKVNSEIRGTVTAVYFNDTKYVKEGEILIELNPQDAEIALAKATAALGSTVRKLREQYIGITQYKALIKQQTVTLEKAKNDYHRRIFLAEKNIISKEELEHTKSAMLAAEAALQLTLEQEKTALSNIEGVEIINHPTLQQVKADFIESWLNLKRTTIVAPLSGYVANKNVQVGNIVAPGTPLLTIISLNQLWIDANFKETQLKNIKINQDVTITTDIYGHNVVFHGKVAGLSAGTGSAFSLLPAQNATGNWIKIVQRVPVRIILEPLELKKHPLRIGLSTKVKVDIKDQSGGDLYKTPLNNSPTTTVLTYNLKEAEAAANKIINQNLKKDTLQKSNPSIEATKKKATIKNPSNNNSLANKKHM